MKKLISVLLVTVMLSTVLYGCKASDKKENGDITAAPTQTEGNKDSDSKPADDQKNEDPDKENTVPEGPIDMEALLTEIANANPGADPDRIEKELLKNPYFVLFQHENTEYYYPGMNYEFVPEGISKSICITDFVTNSGALVYVIVPNEGVDPETIIEAFKQNADPQWMNFEKATDSMFGKVIDGKVYFAMYNEDMQPVTGKIAEKARDIVDMFHEYVKENPDAGTLKIAEYFAKHQKFSSLITNEVSEGRIMGFGDFEKEVEIKGFAEGAGFVPRVSPSLFIGYVFRVADGTDAEAFASMLKENANLAWNVCMAANTVITETDGNLVLFMMCSE